VAAQHDRGRDRDRRRGCSRRSVHGLDVLERFACALRDAAERADAGEAPAQIVPQSRLGTGQHAVVRRAGETGGVCRQAVGVCGDGCALGRIETIEGPDQIGTDIPAVRHGRDLVETIRQ
jgi:hypothetical protein